jgi:hypothetical protein
VRQVVAGNLDDQPVFLDLVQVLTAQTEWCLQGCGNQNMKYPPALDDWCHELLCIHPEAYCSFCRQFGGRSERSFLEKQSACPIFLQGISPQVLQHAHKYLEEYKYPLEAPLALSVNNTKLLPAFWPYFDRSANKWFLVGKTSKPLEVADIDKLADQIDSARELLATKLWLWELQIPLPHVPPLVLAVMPLVSSTDSASLTAMEQWLLKILLLCEKPLCIVSLGSDGSVVEREAHQALVQSGFADQISHSIPHPEGSQLDNLCIPVLQIYRQHIAIIQDLKHCRKTGRNNLFSGAWLLVLGNHTVCYEQVQSMASEADNLLYWQDVDRLDRQDDRATARLFSASFLHYSISRHGDSNPGLPVYLFIIGELVDAYENCHIPHIEHVRMVLQMHFFKSQWKSFLQASGYQENKYFISADTDNIIDTLINGFLALIFIHQDHLSMTFPLLPWMHGSEANEHVFGLFRLLIPDFTMLDVLQLIPKLKVRLMAACKAKNVQVEFRCTAVGYSHTYFDANDIPLGMLSEFPSDQEIAQAAIMAYDKANSLWDLLRYYHTSTSDNNDPAPSNGHQNLPDLPNPHEDAKHLDELEDSIHQDLDHRSLQEALVSCNSNISGLNSNAHACLNKYSYAAACLNFEDQEKM